MVTIANTNSCSMIRKKLGWDLGLITALSSSEVDVVLAMIEKHDAAERRLDNRLSEAKTGKENSNGKECAR